MTEYKITSNASDTGSILTNQTFDTIFILDDVTAGIYHFMVVAVNILGEGADKSVTGNIGLQLKESLFVMKK